MTIRLSAGSTCSLTISYLKIGGYEALCSAYGASTPLGKCGPVYRN
ncbi:hypothetical protein FOXYSP1_07094 [Fusarium oxysporum f. sp. phaseoli]